MIDSADSQTGGLRASDVAPLADALALAEQAIGVSDPNPRVGCVLHDASGQAVGAGHTQPVGGPHAEVMALREAAAAGRSVRGGSAWVTLEPCAHHGRTPPCAQALIDAGLARVVVALQDPFAAVAGRGIAMLRAAGIEVCVLPTGHALARRARALNIGFLSRVQRGQPWVRLKSALTIDGRTALADGRSQWITGAEARTDGHAWRRRAGVVLTGRGTVQHDDPRLDVRLVPTLLQPERWVLDSGLRLTPQQRIFQPPGRVRLVTTQAADAPAVHAWAGRGVRCVHLPDADGQADLRALWPHMAAEGINEVHVEAGAGLSGALLQAELVDELLLYLAPKLLGPGRPVAELPALPTLDQASSWQWLEAQTVGADLRLRALAPQSVAFWHG